METKFVDEENDDNKKQKPDSEEEYLEVELISALE
jgi:hypothetical protein